MTEPEEDLPEQDEEREGSLLNPWMLLRAIQKNWFLIVPMVALGIAVAAFYTLSLTKVYSAQTTLVFDPRPTAPLGNDVQTVVELGAGNYWTNQEYYKTQHHIIRSQKVCEEAVRKLQLHKNPQFIAGVPQDTELAPKEVSVEEAARQLSAQTTVTPIKDSRLAEVVFEDGDPERAHRIVNVLVDTYVQQNIGSAVESTDDAAEWLSGQLTKLKKELEKSEMSLHNYKLDNRILSVSLDDQSNLLLNEMTTLSSALTTARTKREGIRARKIELDKVNEKDPLNLPAHELIESELLSQLRTSYIEQTQARDALLSRGKGENHPEVLAVSAQVSITRKALLSEVSNVKAAVDKDYRVVNREIAGLSRLVGSAKQRALELNLLEIEYNRLQRTRDNTDKLYALVLERSKTTDLTRMMRFNNIRVMDRAPVEKKPIRPNTPAAIAVGAVLGLALGLLLAIGRELMDRTVKSPDDLGTLNILGGLPSSIGDTEYKGPQELYIHSRPASGAAEAARAIRTNIMFMAPDNPFRTLLVTSPGPEEGKTTVATNLAIVMAQAGSKVLLVDCDMRRPRVHKVFGFNREKGITTALLDPSSLMDGVHETEIENLYVMPCGPLPPTPAELIHSAAFGRLIEQLKERFDRVVFDTPPVVPVTDAAVLSTRVDATILVARLQVTSKDGLRQARRSITGVGGNLIGALLNAVEVRKRGYGKYGNYYTYKHDGYAPRDEDQDEAA